MNLQESKNLILKLCDYEKRIVLRNSIAIFVVVTLLLFFFYKQIVAFAGIFLQNMNSGVEDNSDFSTYYKFGLPFIILTMISYPAFKFYQVLKRKEKVVQLYKHINDGEEIQIFEDQTIYLTIIPLIWLKLKLNPITLLNVHIKNKSYQIPIDKNYASDIKSSLAKVDLEKANTIKDLIFNNSETTLEAPKINLKTVNEFKNFARNEFESEITKMEASRKTNKSMFVVQSILAFVFIGAIIYFTKTGLLEMTNSNAVFVLIGSVIGFSIITSIGYMYYHKKKNNGNVLGDYTKFKKSVYSRLVNFLNPSFQYAQNSHVNLTDFLHSGLFVEKNYEISGGDQISGIHNGIPFQSCNLSVTYRPQLRNEKEADDTVFYGNYFVAKFNKKFNYPIYIIPKKKVFGSMSDNSISQYSDGSRIKVNLEDPEFNKQFTVYCDDQVMARYVLTPAMMERIKKINTKSNGNLYIAINDQNILLATNQANVSIDMNNIRNSMFQKLDMEVLHNLYEELYENIEVIDLLKLNINIWK